MVIKSGEGVVYLTRPQKFSQSSQPPKQLPEFSSRYPTQIILPRPTKTDANSPQYGYIQRLLTPKVPYLTERCRPDCTGGKGKPSNKLGGAFLTIRCHAAQGKAMN